MRSTIVKRSGLDILKLKPIEDVDTCFIPALFTAGVEDSFIPPKHTSDICDKYAGEKNVVLVEGGHNTRRPAYFLDSVSFFIYNRICVPVGLTEDRLGLRPRLEVLPGQGRSSPIVSELGSYTPQNPLSAQSGLPDDLEEQELQEALMASLAEAEGAGEGVPAQDRVPLASAPGRRAAAAGGQGDGTLSAQADRLVGCATSQAQSTLPSRRTAADS